MRDFLEYTQVSINIIDNDTNDEVFLFDGPIRKAYACLEQNEFDEFSQLLEETLESCEDLDEEFEFELDNLICYMAFY